MPLTTQAVRLPLGSACCPFKNSLCCRQTSRGLWTWVPDSLLSQRCGWDKASEWFRAPGHYFTVSVQCALLLSASALFFSLSFFKHMLLKFNPFSLSMETICQYNTSPSDAYDSWNKFSLKVKSSSNKKWLLTRWEALRGNVLLLSDRNLKFFFFSAIEEKKMTQFTNFHKVIK